MKKHIGLVVKDDDKARQQADRFEHWLVKKGLTVIRRQSGIPCGEAIGRFPGNHRNRFSAYSFWAATAHF
jgi:hypothetical protein